MGWARLLLLLRACPAPPATATILLPHLQHKWSVPRRAGTWVGCSKVQLSCNNCFINTSSSAPENLGLKNQLCKTVTAHEKFKAAAWAADYKKSTVQEKKFIESVAALEFHQHKLWQKIHDIAFLVWNEVFMSALISQLVAQFLEFSNHVVHSCHLNSYLPVNLITCYIYEKLLHDKKK